MCGLIGILLAPQTSQPFSLAQLLIDAMTVLQHRGQDAAGIVTCNKENNNSYKLNTLKEVGLVKEVFRQDNVTRLTGNIGIGHVRYPTAGSKSCIDEAQPLYTNAPLGKYSDNCW